MKTFYILILSFFLMSCATLPQQSAEREKPQVLGEGQPTTTVPAIEGQQDPSLTESEETSLEEKPPPAFAVWIDSVGYDAFAALGLLQELEKVGLKPAKVVGTGFGCYVALAWAFENNGNQAEWQSLKWSSWDSLKSSSFLGKIAGQLNSKSAENNFKEKVERILPVKSFSQLKIPADCPLFQREPLEMRSSKEANLSLSEALWLQFQVPILSKFANEPIPESLLSGVVGGLPQNNELEFMTKDITAKWLVVRTRHSKDRSGPAYWSEVLSERADKIQASAAPADSSQSLVIDISGAESRPSRDILKPESRRSFLLEGRKSAKNILKSENWKKFIESSH